jgi:hypothetical protein
MSDTIEPEAPKIREFMKWLDGEFGSHCAEGDYTEGCLSCDAGYAIKYLSRMLDTINPPSHNPEKEE